MIDRRMILLGAAAVTIMSGVRSAHAMVDYTPGLVRERLAAGETVFVDFSATWCSTCRAQGRVIEGLRAANPAYDAAMTFVRVDWDSYGTGPLARSLSVPRRSTLILLRGDTELGRIVAGTREDEIRALMDRGLA